MLEKMERCQEQQTNHSLSQQEAAAVYAGPADAHTHAHAHTIKDVDDGAAGNMTNICIWPVFDTNEANQNSAHSNRVVIGCVE